MDWLIKIFLFLGSSLEEILAAARDQPDSVEPGLVDDVDSDETSSEASDDEDDDPRLTEPLKTIEADKNLVASDSSNSSDENEGNFEFVKESEAVEVILKSALEEKPVDETEDSSEDEADEVNEEEAASTDVVDNSQEAEKRPAAFGDFVPQVPEVATSALDYPEAGNQEDSSAPSSLESQGSNGPASVIIEAQEVPTPDSGSFIIKTSETQAVDLPTPQEAIVEVIPQGRESSQSPILEESEDLEDSEKSPEATEAAPIQEPVEVVDSAIVAPHPVLAHLVDDIVAEAASEPSEVKPVEAEVPQVHPVLAHFEDPVVPEVAEEETKEEKPLEHEPEEDLVEVENPSVEAEQPTFDVVEAVEADKVAVDEDLIVEEKAALSSLEEAISAAEEEVEAEAELLLAPRIDQVIEESAEAKLVGADETPEDTKVEVEEEKPQEIIPEPIEEPVIEVSAPIDLLGDAPVESAQHDTVFKLALIEPIQDLADLISEPVQDIPEPAELVQVVPEPAEPIFEPALSEPIKTAPFKPEVTELPAVEENAQEVPKSEDMQTSKVSSTILMIPSQISQEIYVKILHLTAYNYTVRIIFDRGKFWLPDPTFLTDPNAEWSEKKTLDENKKEKKANHISSASDVDDSVTLVTEMTYLNEFAEPCTKSPISKSSKLWQSSNENGLTCLHSLEMAVLETSNSNSQSTLTCPTMIYPDNQVFPVNVDITKFNLKIRWRYIHYLNLCEQYLYQYSTNTLQLS